MYTRTDGAKPLSKAGVYRCGGGSVLPGNRYFRWTGERRIPKRGEWYLSGAIIEAYQAPADNMVGSHYIAVEVVLVSCVACNGRGMVVDREKETREEEEG